MDERPLAVCPGCEALLPVSDMYCSACGASLRGAQRVQRRVPAPEPVAPQETTAHKPAKYRKSRWGWLVFILAFLCLAPSAARWLRRAEPTCIGESYASEVAQLLRNCDAVTSETVVALQEQDVQQVLSLQLEFRKLSARWHAMDPPTCAQAAHDEFGKALVSYDAMLNAWVKGDQEGMSMLLDKAMNEWLTATGMYLEIAEKEGVEWP